VDHLGLQTDQYVQGVDIELEEAEFAMEPVEQVPQ
jgi:hypothetical protein